MREKFLLGVLKLRNRRDELMNDHGDIVQTILLIVVFVAIIAIVGGVLTTAISDKGDVVADCINNPTQDKCVNNQKK